MATHRVTGNIKVGGQPAARPVHAHDAATGALVGSTTSNIVNGDYIITLDSGADVFVLVEPPTGYRSAIKGPVTPEAI